MKTTLQRACKRLAAVAALSWAAFGLLWAQVLVLPNPLVLPRVFVELLLGEVPAATNPRRFAVMVVKETSLLLCGFALIGFALATLARRVEAHRSAFVAASLCTVTVAISLVPVAQAWRTVSRGDPMDRRTVCSKLFRRQGDA